MEGTKSVRKNRYFVGRPPIPVLQLILTIVGFMLCIIPGIIMYVVVIRKMIQLQNIVITTSPVNGGAEVVIKHSPSASKLVSEFLNALPPYTT